MNCPDHLSREFSKGQAIRLLDVFAIGPTMIYVSIVAEKVNPLLRGFLLISGVATVLYNGRNYLKVQERTEVPKDGKPLLRLVQ